MTSILQHLQLIMHQVFKDFLAVNYFFFNYLNRTFYVGMAVESYANLAEATFSKHSSNLVPFFYILDIFKSFKIFEV